MLEHSYTVKVSDNGKECVVIIQALLQDLSYAENTIVSGT